MEHLLDGLYDKPSGPTRKAFERTNLSYQDIVAIVSKALNTPLSASRLSSVPPISDLPPCSKHVEEALQNAYRGADARNDTVVRSRDLLAGAWVVKDCTVIQALAQAGVTDAIVLEAIAADVPDGFPRPDSFDAYRSPTAPVAIGAATVSAGFSSDLVRRTSGQPLSDELGARDEVNALCSVIASSDVQPPLSIGLFGEWGSGKSYFMKLMQERIELIADQSLKRREAEHQAASNDKRPERPVSSFCANIVQLEFNAWHYADTNLWASLATEIFEELDRKLGERNDPAEQREKLLQEVKSRQDKLFEAEKRKRELNEKLDGVQKLLEQQSDLTLGQDALRASLESLKHLAVTDPDLRTSLETFATKAGFEQGKIATAEFRSFLVDLEGFSGTLSASWRLLGQSANWKIRAGLFLVIFAIPFVVPPLVVWLGASGVTAWVAGGLASVVGLVVPLIPIIRSATALVGNLETARKEAAERLRVAREAREAPLRKDQERLKTELEAARDRFDALKQEQAALEQQIAELRADQQLYKFIRGRHESKDYSQFLGVISKAREDFENLSALFERARQEPELGLPKIDRIVLYIDDLDRCPEDKVVQVLQAVHLLLAFPLFVVVVGVDPRWLLHSLREHSSAFNVAANGGDPGSGLDASWASTPQHYLEKIFQIPFALRPMVATGFERLIDGIAPASKRASQGAGGIEPTSGGDLDPPNRDTNGPNLPTDKSEYKNDSPNGQGGLENRPAAGQPLDLTIDLQPKNLELTDAERTLMKALYPLIPSPRAAKRFVNTYRLLRATLAPSDLEGFESVGYRAALVLMAALSGFPLEAEEFFERIRLSKSTQWTDFLVELAKPARSNLEHWPELHLALASLQSNDGVLPSASDSPASFTGWLERVQRYSFRIGRPGV